MLFRRMSRRQSMNKEDRFIKLLKEDVPPVKLGNKNTTGKCGMCGIKVKKLYPCKSWTG